MVERNVFQLAQRLRYYGKGYNLTRKSWDRYPNSFWTVTKIKFKENSVDHGKAYGVLTWRGVPQDKITAIRSSRKSEWKLFDDKVPYFEDKHLDFLDSP